MAFSNESDSDDYKPVLPRSSTSSTTATTSKRKAPRTSSAATATGSAGGGGRAVSCLQCRVRKLQCDLNGPACGSCIKKGEGETCSLGLRLWYDNPADAPAAKLKASVDRLETLVHKIRRSPPPSSPYARPPPPPNTNDASISVSTVPALTRAAVTGSVPMTKKSKTVTAATVEALSRLVLAGSVDAVTAAKSKSAVDLTSLSADLQYAPVLSPAPLPHLVTPSTAPPPVNFTLAAVFGIMPTPFQALHTLSSFFNPSSSFSTPSYHAPIFHQKTFMAQVQGFWDRCTASSSGPSPAREDALWLATYFAACGLGLLAMGEEEARGYGFPAGEGKALLARSWLDASLGSLNIGQFLVSPTIESLRAVVLLNRFWSTWNGGIHLPAAIQFNSSVLASAFELELHLELDTAPSGGEYAAPTSPVLSPLEREDRRRVFWNLFAHDTLARALVGVKYHPLDVERITTRYPTKDDEAFSAIDGAEVASLPLSVERNEQQQRWLDNIVALACNRVGEKNAVLGQGEERALGCFTVLKAKDASVSLVQSAAFELLDMLETSGSGAWSESGQLILGVAVGIACVRLGVEFLEVSHSRLTHFSAHLLGSTSSHFPLVLQPLLQRVSILLAHVRPSLPLQPLPPAQPAYFTPHSTPITSDFSTPHSTPSLGVVGFDGISSAVSLPASGAIAAGRSHGYWTGGADVNFSPQSCSTGNESFLDTPPMDVGIGMGFGMGGGFDPSSRRLSDQNSLSDFRSPLLPFDQSVPRYDSASYGDVFSDDAPFLQDASLFEPCPPLLKPWLDTKAEWAYGTTLLGQIDANGIGWDGQYSDPLFA